MPRFELRKWYFDCVSSAGEVFIGYAAKLRFGLIRMDYSSIITHGNCRQSFSFGKLKQSDRSLEWSNDSLGVDGKWAGQNGGNKKILYDGKEGRIEWQCLKPNAKVSIHLAGRDISGRGYAEQIYMTVPPWKLPFDELRWGRFIGDNQKDYVIWIDLKGELCKTWVWTSNGLSQGEVQDKRIITKEQRLILKGFKPIRQGYVSNSLLGRLSFFSNLLPRKLRKIEENKYLSRGELILQNGSKINGSSICEVVKWN